MMGIRVKGSGIYLWGNEDDFSERNLSYREHQLALYLFYSAINGIEKLWELGSFFSLFLIFPQ